MNCDQAPIYSGKTLDWKSDNIKQNRMTSVKRQCDQLEEVILVENNIKRTHFDSASGNQELLSKKKITPAFDQCNKQLLVQKKSCPHDPRTKSATTNRSGTGRGYEAACKNESVGSLSWIDQCRRLEIEKIELKKICTIPL